MRIDDAKEILKEYVTNKNLVKHMVATEACMKRLARHLGEDEDRWALAGLLHDIDYEKTKEDPSKHGIISAEILREHGIEDEILDAIIAHSGNSERRSRMDHALYAVDPLTGLIVACALMHPDRKLASLDKEFVMRRFKEKRFAQGADRDQIKKCEELGLSLEEFVDLCLAAMTGVASELGL